MSGRARSRRSAEVVVSTRPRLARGRAASRSRAQRHDRRLRNLWSAATPTAVAVGTPRSAGARGAVSGSDRRRRDTQRLGGEAGSACATAAGSTTRRRGIGGRSTIYLLCQANRWGDVRPAPARALQTQEASEGRTRSGASCPCRSRSESSSPHDLFTGRTVWAVGDVYTIKATGAQTNGGFGFVEATVPAGGGPQAHAHPEQRRRSTSSTGNSSSWTATTSSRPCRVTSSTSRGGSPSLHEQGQPRRKDDLHVHASRGGADHRRLRPACPAR